MLYSEDLEAVGRRIEEAGGRIVKPAYPFPGGRRFHFADPDGHELAVWTEGLNGGVREACSLKRVGVRQYAM